jgi:hypothetical protein
MYQNTNLIFYIRVIICNTYNNKRRDKRIPASLQFTATLATFGHTVYPCAGILFTDS